MTEPNRQSGENEERIIEIEIERLRPFKEHPFQVKDDKEMFLLQESIEKYGILNPLIVRPVPDGYYEMCGQMKTLLDRLNPLYSTDYSFRDIYMIATAAENDESAFEKAYNGLQGWVDCFEKASLKGMVGGGGIDAANIAASHVDVMKKAYELGKKL